MVTFTGSGGHGSAVMYIAICSITASPPSPILFDVAVGRGLLLTFYLFFISQLTCRKGIVVDDIDMTSLKQPIKYKKCYFGTERAMIEGTNCIAINIAVNLNPSIVLQNHAASGGI